MTWSRNTGPRTMIPRGPTTTLGIAASLATGAVTGPRIRRGASSVRKSAIPSASGVARSNAPREVTAAPKRKTAAPILLWTGSQPMCERNPSPKVERPSREPSTTLYAIRPSRTTAPAAAVPATPCRRTSPRRARRPAKGRRAVSLVASKVLTSRRDSLLVELPEGLVRGLDHRARHRREDVRLDRVLRVGAQRELDERLDLGRLRARGRNDHVGERRHRPGVLVLLRRRWVRDRDLVVGGDLRPVDQLRRRLDRADLRQDVGVRKRELLVCLLVHEVHVRPVVVEVLDTLR